jgi:hypothetical protein
MVEIIILCAAVASIVFGITIVINSKKEKTIATITKQEKPIVNKVDIVKTKPAIQEPVKTQVKPKVTNTSKNTAKPEALAKMEAKPKSTKNKK